MPQHRVRVRFYQELGDFLAPHLRGREFELTASRGTTTKALVEHCGVPHGEVDLLLVEGESVDFSYQVQHGQRVSVFPVFESFDISALTRVRPAPLRVVAVLGGCQPRQAGDAAAHVRPGRHRRRHAAARRRGP